MNINHLLTTLDIMFHFALQVLKDLFSVEKYTELHGIRKHRKTKKKKKKTTTLNVKPSIEL